MGITHNCKIRVKSTGEVKYCITNTERRQLTNEEEKRLPLISRYKTTYYKDDTMTEAYEREEIEIVPIEPYEEFGIECGDGWLGIIQPILEYIDRHNEGVTDQKDKITITQIKEKFAELRIYCDKYTDELRAMIDEATLKSHNVCEMCGTEDDVGITVNGYYQTVCRECVGKKASLRGRDVLWKRYSDGKLYSITPLNNEEVVDFKEWKEKH